MKEEELADKLCGLIEEGISKILSKNQQYQQREKIISKLKEGKMIKQFPHCDQRILHAPGVCTYCDEHSDWQDLRKAWGIAFSGEKPLNGELPDPATYARGDKWNNWYGNVAKSYNEDEKLKQDIKDLLDKFIGRKTDDIHHEILETLSNYFDERSRAFESIKIESVDDGSPFMIEITMCEGKIYTFSIITTK